MSTPRTLLLEIGCEEIPARMLAGAGDDLTAAVVQILERANIGHGETRTFWSPRRLAVQVFATEPATEAAERTISGPPVAVAWDAGGQLTRAGEGFARKQGIAPEQLVRIETDKGSYAAARINVPRRPLAEILAAEFVRRVSQITFPKTMRWGDGRHSFVRPVHWLVALHGADLLALSLFDVSAGRETRGHRVLSPGAVAIGHADEYSEVLEHAGVIVDPDRRREQLKSKLDGEARTRGGELVRDDDLLRETADMVEYPGVCSGELDPRFIEELPDEVLSTCLKHHQRAFTIAGKSGLLPAFAVAVNSPRDPQGHIRRGNEWVVSGRLEDALFFWNEDRRSPLADRAEALSGVVFQRDLGSYADKTARVERLASALVDEYRPDEQFRELVVRAARLSRCDLVTGLVGEFPELQGLAGGLLASADGEAEEVVRAVYHFYRPAGKEDELPPTVAGRLVGLADRLDTLAGTFAVGLSPTGSKDPFALRRAGTAAVRLAAAGPSVELNGALRLAVEPFTVANGPLRAAEEVERTLVELIEFLFERFATGAAAVGARYDEIAALKPLARSRFRPSELQRKLTALGRFRGSEDFLALASASKRVRNILGQAAERGEPVTVGQESEALQLPAETDLGRSLSSIASRIVPFEAEGDYEAALGELASLRPDVDRFFDEVLVMDEDQLKRRARLGLLARFHELAHAIVDISELVVEGKSAS